jgi:hypothetical protein
MITIFCTFSIPPIQVRKSQDSVLSVVARLRAGQTRVQILAWARDFSPKHPYCLQRPYTTLFKEFCGVLSPEVKWLGHEDHSHPSSVEVTTEQSYTSLLPMCLHGI